MIGWLAPVRDMVWRPSLRARLILILTITFCAALLGAGSFFYWEARGIESGLRERSLQEQARELLDALPKAGSGQAASTALRSVDPIYAHPGAPYGYTLFGSDGRVAANSASRSGREPLPLTQVPTPNDQFGPVFFVGPSRTAALTARVPRNRFLVVSRDDADPKTLAESLVEQDATPLLILAPFVLLTFALIVIVINRTLRPLERASFQASRIGPASSADRIASQGLPSEIVPLVTAFNGALDRLSKAFQFEKDLTAAAAHELRTPIAVLRMRLERARLNEGNAQLDWGAIQRDLAHIERVTAQLLDLARAEQGRTDGRLEEVNLSRIAREAAALVLPLVEDAGRSLEVLASDPVSIARADADSLRDMVRNLTENALVHGKGAITVEVKVDPSRKVATLAVTDEGDGVPDALHAAMFERFRKGRSSTPGAGLGLAIVRNIVDRHGGTVSFVESPGCRIEVSLP